jgi:mono/diheme cytochrome c family protein
VNRPTPERRRLAGWIALLALLPLTACRNPSRTFTAPQRLGGVLVAPEVLNEGQRTYAAFCTSCHGEKGDGLGPSARGLHPPARDFTRGIFKFGSVPAGQLPTDEDLIRIVAGGLRGTAMTGWEVPRPQLQAVVQYVKTFSPRWQGEQPGQPIRPTPDPWTGRDPAAVERGKQVYHGLARCQACHPAYASRDEMEGAARALTGGEAPARPEPYAAIERDSDYGVRIRAPDFTHDELSSVRPEHWREDLYRVIAAGVGGTAMPTWRGALDERDLWALVHYVDWLAGLRGTPEGKRLLQQLRTPP